EPLQPKYFKDLGAQRVRITYGPYLVAGSGDAATHGMQAFPDMDAMMPCYGCLVTGYVPDLKFSDDGTSANANKNMWLHHIGLMNLNRSAATCTHWPESISVNGNERSPFDFTIKGTRKAGYYLGTGDQVMLTTEVMNLAAAPRNVSLTIEWEFLPGTPDGFDVVTPVWLDARGNCLDEPDGIPANATIFNATSTTGWTAPFAGDLVLAVPHVHDGSTGQEVFRDGALVCRNVPGYGETSGYITHLPGAGGHHDHGSDSHVMHVSSISQCADLGPVAAGAKFTISSHYNMTAHTPMRTRTGAFEPIMGIEFLH
ncbi:hypothetical protein B0T26DRAFT_606462, partial [Lasiosphaeria miniovina]